MIQEFTAFLAKDSQHTVKENNNVFLLRTCLVTCIFQIGFANDATLYRAMHKQDSAAAPLLLCADNIRLHGCGRSWNFLSSFGRKEETEDWRKQYFIYITLWQTFQKHQSNGVNPALKQEHWSAQRKNNDAQRISWGEVGQAVQI